MTAFTAMLNAQAQLPGDLDATFGTSGYAMNDFIAGTGEVWWDMVVLSDDKIIQVGYSDDGNDKDILIAKFNADGTSDATFGTNGLTTIDLSLGLDEEARGVCVLDDGKLLITGYLVDFQAQAYQGFVMRLNDDGTVDSSFGTTAPGYTQFNAGDNVIAYGRSVLMSGGEIYVGASANANGQADMFLFNFSIGGGLDVSFASGGAAQVDIDGENDLLVSMERAANGTFVLVGTSDSMNVQHASVTVLSQFGTPTTFGTKKFDFGSGWNEANAVYVDDNNFIYVAGGHGLAPNVDGYVMRFKNDGSGDLDATYATNGVMESDPGATTGLSFRKILPVWDGGIVVTGELNGALKQLYAMMLESDGSLQTAFDGGDVYVPFSISVISEYAYGGGMQSDGSIIIGGFLTSQDFVGENLFMVRLAPYEDASSLFEVESNAVKVYPNPAKSTFSIDMEDVEMVQLISMQGAIVTTWNESNGVYQIPSNVDQGTYLIRVQSADGVATTPLIVQ